MAFAPVIQDTVPLSSYPAALVMSATLTRSKHTVWQTAHGSDNYFERSALVVASECHAATRDWAQNSRFIVDGNSVVMMPAQFVFRRFSQYVQRVAKVVATTGSDALASAAGKLFSFAMPAHGWATVTSQ